MNLCGRVILKNQPTKCAPRTFFYTFNKNGLRQSTAFIQKGFIILRIGRKRLKCDNAIKNAQAPNMSTAITLVQRDTPTKYQKLAFSGVKLETLYVVNPVTLYLVPLSTEKRQHVFVFPSITNENPRLSLCKQPQTSLCKQPQTSLCKQPQTSLC